MRRRGRRAKKSVGIRELLGIALGCMGMPLADFCQLTPDEFQSAYRAWADMKEQQERSAWERMQAAITIQPHVKGKITPQRLLPFPWETQPKKPRRKATTAEEDKKRFEKVLRKTGKGLKPPGEEA